MVLYICTKFLENITEDYVTIFLLKFSKGHNSIKNAEGVTFLVSVYDLMVLHICTNFRENIFKGFRAIE